LKVDGTTEGNRTDIGSYHCKKGTEILKNWDACCEEAFKEVYMIGLHSTKNSQKNPKLYQELRNERKKVNLLHGKHNLPPFLQQNQDLTTELNKFGQEHLHE
jgi:hypothetical protein